MLRPSAAVHSGRVRCCRTAQQCTAARERVSAAAGSVGGVLIHADGFGSRELKLDSWRSLRSDGAEEFWWGWKNFYDEDTPTMTPAQTLEVEPPPVFISYQ